MRKSRQNAPRASSPAASEPAGARLLLQKPTLSATQVAFAFAGDIWIVDRAGGEARRLTAGPGIETDPHFSPDGRSIAFTGQYEGNVDVFVMPATGGSPRRLTYHPGDDAAVGWTPDGARVLFRSARSSFSRFTRLFTIAAEGGFPEELPLPRAVEGAFSPDGSRFAYVPMFQQGAWKRYRGGQATSVQIALLEDSSVTTVPRENSNDFSPIWVGEMVYFLSDRDGPITLYRFDPKNGKVQKALENRGRDLRCAAAGPGAIVLQRLGQLSLFDLETGSESPLEIRLEGDFLETRPRFRSVARQIQAAGISPTGARAVFEAHGEILTVPAEKGDIRNLTRSPGVAERDPAWSPDGRWIACFSDESGEYALQIRDPLGKTEPRSLQPGDRPSFYYQPTWSPDSKKIAYTDKRLNLWCMDLESGKPTRVAVDTYDVPWQGMDPCWSPDSLWIAYTRQLKSHLTAVFLYSLETGRSQQVTDGMSDARLPAFDRSGKYLYFTASTDVGLGVAWLDLSSQGRVSTRSVYAAVLSRDLPSPLAPESDDEKPDEKPSERPEPTSKETPKAAEPIRVDFDHLDQRILALPIPAAGYTQVMAGPEGVILLVERPPFTPGPPNPDTALLHKFDLKERKFEKILDGFREVHLSSNGEKLLYRRGDSWIIGPAAASPPPGSEKPGDPNAPKTLKLNDLEVQVEPLLEWRQMFREVWRIQRDFFYDPGCHGLNLEAAEREFEPYLAGVYSREDLNSLFREMLAEMCVGHLFVAGGDLPEVTPVRAGLLGADYTIENGRYRFARIYSGENWNPDLKAPLTQPGVNVEPGDYLLAVNGQELRAGDNLYSLFQKTAGKSVTLRVGPDPEGAGREVTVVPVESEAALRNLSWVEDNRRRVDEATGGRVAYIYLPDTARGGYTNFNRYFFAQVGKEAAIIDERYNGGGQAADYIVDYLRRPLLSRWATREGDDFNTPLGAIFGPKVMIINESAGSGGDALPWYFRRLGIGPLIGTRTWGGLVGIYSYPTLMDGGWVTAPRLAFYTPEGEWEVENNGVPPDIEVELDPKAWREGRDLQLERAIEVTLDLLNQNPPSVPRRPAYPIHHTG